MPSRVSFKSISPVFKRARFNQFQSSNKKYENKNVDVGSRRRFDVIRLNQTIVNSFTRNVQQKIAKIERLESHIKIESRRFLYSGFSYGYSGFCHCCTMLRPLYGRTGCCIIGQTPIMQWLEVIIARLDQNGEKSTSDETDQDMLAPNCSPHPPQTSWSK